MDFGLIGAGVLLTVYSCLKRGWEWLADEAIARWYVWAGVAVLSAISLYVGWTPLFWFPFAIGACVGLIRTYLILSLLREMW